MNASRSTREGPASSGRRLPCWLPVLYTLFVVVLVPVYTLEYGLANFLWFSNIALLLTLLATWFESRWLASMQAISVSLLELGWIGDFLVGMALGSAPLGLAEYMFDREIPVFVRALSLYHVVLPFLLLWLVYRLGYQPRAWIAQTLLAWIVLLVCYLFTDPADNINWVFGPGGEPQRQIPRPVYLALVMMAYPLAVHLPTHLVLRWLFASHPAPARGG